MDFRIEELGGLPYLVAESTNDDGSAHIHQIDMRAISSWGLLLGLTDPGEIAQAILTHKEEPVLPGENNMWTDLYDSLGQGLDAMSMAGVPPEYMEDLLDPELGAPVPGVELLDVIEEARGKGRDKVKENKPDKDMKDELNELLSGHEEKIKEIRLEFVDKLAPVHELPPPPAPASVAEAMDMANGVNIVIPTFGSRLGIPTDA